VFRRALLLAGALGVAAAAASLGFGARASTRAVPRNVPVPAQGAYFGAWVDYGSHWAGSEHALDTVAHFEAQIGRRLAIANRFYGWAEAFPSDLEARDVTLGRIPMVTWKAPRLDAVLNGSQDALIAARARAVRQFGSPLFIRWAWEMNGGWTEWSGSKNETPGRHDGAQKYVRAWRHVHDLFAREGATNVSWVWAPNGESVPARSWNAAAAYYPGDAYVDWIGFSAYNWGSRRSWSRWSPFAKLVAPFYRRWSASKPLMVAETASTGDAAAKARWLDGIAPILPTRFPRLKAVLLFQEPPSWTATDSAAARKALRALATSRQLSARG
jgi:Glycosyl hydrolase family 26